MNRRPHWDLIRGGWAGKWQFPCCFGVCSSPCSRLLCNTINILYLVLIEAVILVRHIIASWPKEKCSFISLLAAICQTDGFALCPETLHIQESSCFHMSCGKMIPPTHPYFFFLSKRHEVYGPFFFFAFPLHISGGSHYSIPRTHRRVWERLLLYPCLYPFHRRWTYRASCWSSSAAAELPVPIAQRNSVGGEQSESATESPATTRK